MLVGLRDKHGEIRAEIGTEGAERANCPTLLDHAIYGLSVLADGEHGNNPVAFNINHQPGYLCPVVSKMPPNW